MIDPGWFFRLTTVITLVGGTMFLMWLGEQITARGIGNGISLIIFAGIVAQLPHSLAATLELGRTGALSAVFIIGLIVLAVAVIFFIVFVERAQRRIIVQYPKRQVGTRVIVGESTHLPLKINTSGVIPPIFASSLLLMPITVIGFMAGTGPEWLTDGIRLPRPRPAALPAPLRRADRLLRLLLYGGRVQPDGDRRQPEEVRRLHPRHPARPRTRPSISTRC